jgi:hypothetical protein
MKFWFAVAAMAAGPVLAFSPVVAVAKETDPIKVASSRTFNGVQQVVVGNFNVAFVFEKTDKAFAGRGTNYGGSSVAKSTLAGITPADFQAITDAAYADFVTKMTAAGYQVADRATTYAAFADIAALRYVASGAEGTVQADKNEKAKALFYAPSAFGSTPIQAGAITGGTFGAFGQMGPAMARSKFSYTSNIPVVDVRYVVDFSNAAFRGGAFSFGSSVKVTAQLAIVETLSTVTLNAPRGLGTLTLQTPVAVNGDFGALADTTTRGQKVDQALGNMIGMLGGIGTRSSKSLTFNAIPEAYRGGAGDAAARANDMVVNRMAALRAAK